MATNADDILNAADLSTGRDSDDALMNKHFEAAGITDDKDETKDVPDANTESGEAGTKPESDKQPADKDTSTSTGKDGKPELGPDGKAKKEEGKVDSAGDLKLDDGTVVKAGAERRYFNQYNVERQRTADLTNQVKQMTESRNSWQGRFRDLEKNVQTTHGADPALVSAGVRMANDLKSDPVGTVKKLVAECLAAGYTIEQLGNGIDMAAITRLIDSKMPSREEQTGPTEQQIDTEVAQEINQFYGAFPDARVHETVLARVLADHPQLSLRDAYFELKQSFASRGFDWNKPLDQQSGPSVANTTKVDNTKPLPNGRATADTSEASKTVIAPANTSTADIVKEAMREAGLNI